MKAMILLAAALLGATGCSAVRGEEQESNFGANTPTAVAADTTQSDPFAAGSQSVTIAAPRQVDDEASAAVAIDFVATGLHSNAPINGTSLLGDGSAIVTFVQPGCEFSTVHSELLAAAADVGDVSFVFVHSGGSRESFLEFTNATGLSHENVVHLDDRSGIITQRFGIDMFPATMLVAADGSLSRTSGALDQERLDSAIALVTS